MRINLTYFTRVTKWLQPNDYFLEKVKSEIPNAVIVERGNQSAVYRPTKEIYQKGRSK